MLNSLFSVRGRIIAVFGLLAIILIATAAGSAWQASVHGSDVDEMESHSSIVTLLQDADEQAGASAQLLQQYVASGDDATIPEIQSRTGAAVESLTGAAAQGGVADLDEIAVEGLSLAGGAGQVIALRQSGDVQGAVAAIEEIEPAFLGFSAGLQEAITVELEEVSALQSSADSASDLSSWFLIVAVATGATFGLAALALIARSLIRRRVSKTASPI